LSLGFFRRDLTQLARESEVSMSSRSLGGISDCVERIVGQFEVSHLSEIDQELRNRKTGQ